LTIQLCLYQLRLFSRHGIRICRERESRAYRAQGNGLRTGSLWRLWGVRKLGGDLNQREPFFNTREGPWYICTSPFSLSSMSQRAWDTVASSSSSSSFPIVLLRTCTEETYCISDSRMRRTSSWRYCVKSWSLEVDVARIWTG
jgi:hypothetical protein